MSQCEHVKCWVTSAEVKNMKIALDLLLRGLTPSVCTARIRLLYVDRYYTGGLDFNWY